MTEQEFRHFYAETARPLKAYLSRITGQTDLADDLLQEAYYRMLRAELPLLDARQQKNYIYKVATNLARDHFRRRPGQETPVEEMQIADSRAVGSTAAIDVQRVLSTIKPQEREMVWLAYVEGASHREISAITGVKEASVRPLLYRVRQKLAALLRDAGLDGGSK
jgi:RNA polymerase sigma-70 factor (ECF subfamily)